MATNYNYLLLNSDDLTSIGELEARERKLTVTLNKSGSVSCSIPLDSDLAYEANELSTSIGVVQNKQIIWTGPIWTKQVDAQSNKMSLTAKSWEEELNYRIIRPAFTDNNTVVHPTEEQTFTNQDAGLIARTLVSIANAQVDMDGITRATHITLPATYPTSQNRTISYTKGQNIGQLINDLSNIEAGFDYYVDPTTRQFIISYSEVINDGVTTIYGRGNDRRDLVLAYEWGPSNLANAGYQTDVSKTVQRMSLAGKSGSSAIVEDVQFMNETGFMFEQYVSLPEVADPDVLLAYGGAEVSVNSRPRKLYDIQPFSYSPHNPNIPEPLVDFNIGDIVSLSAKSGAFDEDKKAVRLFEISIDVDDQDNPKISSIQTSL